MTTKIKTAVLACAALSLGMTASAQLTLTPAEEGRRAFLANNCYGCHGLRGAGGGFVGAPNLRGEAELGDLTEAVREGEDRGMPAFPKLTATDIANLYAYLQSLGTKSEPVFNLWWEPVPMASIPPGVPLLWADARTKRARVMGQ
jgi:mono/diheme cytochrome c family protein